LGSKPVIAVLLCLAFLMPASRAMAADACASKNAPRQQTGIASWYAPQLEGHKTASGEIYSGGLLTAAHMTLPMNTRVKVTNRRNGRSVILRINDRGPFVQGRVIDLSGAAAGKIGMKGGMLPVRIQILCPEDDKLILLVPKKKPDMG
jgi:rare lipoprotein A